MLHCYSQESVHVWGSEVKCSGWYSGMGTLVQVLGMKSSLLFGHGR